VIEDIFDESDSFYIHTLKAFADRVEVKCGVAERGLCHVGNDGWPSIISWCFALSL